MCLPAMWENWVRSLGREDPLEKEMATHSGILAWRIPWTEEPGGSTGSQRVGHDFTFTLFIPSSPLILVYCHWATSPESPGHLPVSLLAVAVALQLSSFQGCEVATGCAAFNCCAALCLASQTVPLRNGQVRRRAEPLRFWLTTALCFPLRGLGFVVGALSTSVCFPALRDCCIFCLFTGFIWGG